MDLDRTLELRTRTVAALGGLASFGLLAIPEIDADAPLATATGLVVASLTLVWLLAVAWTMCQAAANLAAMLRMRGRLHDWSPVAVGTGRAALRSGHEQGVRPEREVVRQSKPRTGAAALAKGFGRIIGYSVLVVLTLLASMLVAEPSVEGLLVLLPWLLGALVVLAVSGLVERGASSLVGLLEALNRVERARVWGGAGAGKPPEPGGRMVPLFSAIVLAPLTALVGLALVGGAVYGFLQLDFRLDLAFVVQAFVALLLTLLGVGAWLGLATVRRLTGVLAGLRRRFSDLVLVAEGRPHGAAARPRVERLRGLAGLHALWSLCAIVVCGLVLAGIGSGEILEIPVFEAGVPRGVVLAVAGAAVLLPLCIVLWGRLQTAWIDAVRMLVFAQDRILSVVESGEEATARNEEAPALSVPRSGRVLVLSFVAAGLVPGLLSIPDVQVTLARRVLDWNPTSVEAVKWSTDLLGEKGGVDEVSFLFVPGKPDRRMPVLEERRMSACSNVLERISGPELEAVLRAAEDPVDRYVLARMGIGATALLDELSDSLLALLLDCVAGELEIVESPLLPIYGVEIWGGPHAARVRAAVTARLRAGEDAPGLRYVLAAAGDLEAYAHVVENGDLWYLHAFFYYTSEIVFRNPPLREQIAARALSPPLDKEKASLMHGLATRYVDEGRGEEIVHHIERIHSLGKGFVSPSRWEDLLQSIRSGD